MRVVVAGGAGLLGTALTTRVRVEGHEVVRLVRRPVEAPDESRWDPYSGDVDRSVIESADIVANTAGASLLANPHSQKWATRMRESRVRTTATLAPAIPHVGPWPA